MLEIMLISDELYGDFEIVDPVAIDIINTPAFQRLKRINQYGGVNFIYPGRFQTSRYDHSLGVYRLLVNFRAGREVQLNGLIHDIGHTAFSHTVDQALGSKSEDFHENNMHLIEGIEEVYELFRQAGITVKAVEEFPEIKKSLPDIGADRLDYVLRDYLAATGEKAELGKKILAGTKLVEHNIVFTDQQIAEEYALTGLEAMWLVIYEPDVAVVYAALSALISQGLETKWLTIPDLFKDDEYVLKLLQSHKQDLEAKYLDIFTRKFTVETAKPGEAYDLEHSKLKHRYFDPTVLITSGNTAKLSELNSDFKVKLEAKIAKFTARSAGERYRLIFVG